MDSSHPAATCCGGCWTAACKCGSHNRWGWARPGLVLGWPDSSPDWAWFLPDTSPGQGLTRARGGA